MTAINPATDIPSNVDTVEKLMYFCHAILIELYPSMVLDEGDGDITRINSILVQLDDGSNSYKPFEILRGSLELNPMYKRGLLRPWDYVEPLGSAVIPAEYKS